MPGKKGVLCSNTEALDSTLASKYLFLLAGPPAEMSSPESDVAQACRESLCLLPLVFPNTALGTAGGCMPPGSAASSQVEAGRWRQEHGPPLLAKARSRVPSRGRLGCVRCCCRNVDLLFAEGGRTSSRSKGQGVLPPGPKLLSPFPFVLTFPFTIITAHSANGAFHSRTRDSWGKVSALEVSYSWRGTWIFGPPTPPSPGSASPGTSIGDHGHQGPLDPSGASAHHTSVTVVTSSSPDSAHGIPGQAPPSPDLRSAPPSRICSPRFRPSASLRPTPR